MAAKTCKDVLSDTNYAADGTPGKQVTRDSDVATTSGKKDSKDLLDVFIDAAGKVDAAALSLSNYDCSEHLLEWLKKVCPALDTAAKQIEKAGKTIGGLTSGVKLGELVQGNTVSKSVCNVITTVFGSVNAILELLVKAAFALFDKIDAFREKMQNALKSLTTAVQECIIDVYDMIEKYLTGLLKMTLEWNWGAFENMLMDCPCICRFVAYITGCDVDENGKNISNEPSKVIHCIREKFWYIDGLNLATALSDIMDTYIKQYLMWFFDAVKLAIDSIFTIFIMPFRMLIKQYANLLRKKIDMTFLIEPLKESHMDCLLIYTRRKVAGVTIYEMNVLDMLNSMKMWVNCLEYICPALSERIKNKVKQFNEKFRLTGDYWDRAYEADLYICCMRADAATDNGYSLMDLRDMWSDLFDRLRACNDRVKETMRKTKWTYGMSTSTTGELAYYVSKTRSDAGTMDSEIGSKCNSVADAVRFASGSDDLENELRPGDYPLTESEDSALREIGKSVAAGTQETPYFGEKWSQFVRYLNFYAFSDTTYRELLEAADKGMGGVSEPYDPSARTQFRQVTTREPLDAPEVTNEYGVTYVDDPENTEVNYWVESDYDEERVNALSNIQWAPEKPGESLVSYYSRMYAAAV